MPAPGDDHVNGQAGFEALLARHLPDALAAVEDRLERLAASPERHRHVAGAIPNADDARPGAALLGRADPRPSVVMGVRDAEGRVENAER